MAKILDVTSLKESYVKGFISKKQLVLKGVDFNIQLGSITRFFCGNGKVMLSQQL